MKNSFYLLAFILAVALAYAVSQTSPQQQPNPGYSQPSMPDTHDMGVPPDQPTNSAAQATKDADNHAHAAVDDSDIQKQVLQQLASHNFNAVAVSVQKGVVTLTGAVASKADRKQARELAKAVAGVKGVREKLVVDAAAASALPAGSSAAPGSSPAGAASVGSTESQQNTAGSIAGNASAAGATQSASPSAQPAATAQQSGSSGGVTGAATGVTGQATGATGASTGVSGSATGVTGSATGATGQATGATGTSAGTMSGQTSGAMTSEEGGDLQGRIENALKAEPTLTGSTVMVNVTGDTIELSGAVPTGKEKQTADRIASSFAANHKVVDRITVTGNGNGVNNPSANPPQGTKPQGADQDQTPPKR